MGQACVPYFSMYIQVMIVGVIRTCKIGRKWGWGFLAPPFINLHTLLIHLLFLLFSCIYHIGLLYSYTLIYPYPFPFYFHRHLYNRFILFLHTQVALWVLILMLPLLHRFSPTPIPYSYTLYYLMYRCSTNFIQLKRLFLSEVFLIQNQKKN